MDQVTRDFFTNQRNLMYLAVLYIMTLGISTYLTYDSVLTADPSEQYRLIALATPMFIVTIFMSAVSYTRSPDWFGEEGSFPHYTLPSYARTACIISIFCLNYIIIMSVDTYTTLLEQLVYVLFAFSVLGIIVGLIAAETCKLLKKVS